MTLILESVGALFVLLGLLIGVLIACSRNSAIIVVAPMIIAATSAIVGGILLIGVCDLLSIAKAVRRDTHATAAYFTEMQKRTSNVKTAA